MTELEIVTALYDAWGSESHDLASIRKILDPDISIRDNNDVPWAGSYNGFAGFEEYVTKLMSVLACAPKPREFIHAGSTVVVIGETDGSIKGETDPFDAKFAHVWEIKNGKITKYRPYLEMQRVKENFETVRRKRQPPEKTNV